MKNVIYGLYCTHCEVEEIRYVGQTSRGIAVRFKEHLTVDVKTACHIWIKSHGPENIQFIVLETFETPEALDDREIFWIAYQNTHIEANPRGKNQTLGGKSKRGYVTPPETRDKMAAAHLGKKASPEARAAISKALTGKKRGPRSDEDKEKIRQGRLASSFVYSEESRKKMSESHKGVKLPPERAKKNRRASHIRWHVNKGVTNPNCDFC